MVPRSTTTTYPTRYAAFSNPGHLVLLVGDERGEIWPAGFRRSASLQEWMKDGGREVAVFSEPARNRDLPGCSDGIYLEIVTQTPRIGGVVVSLQVSSPTYSRTQWNQTRTVPSLPEALDLAETLITEARTWVADRVKRESILVSPSGRRFAILETPEGLQVLRMMSPKPVALVQGEEVSVLDGLAFGPPAEEAEIVSALQSFSTSRSKP